MLILKHNLERNGLRQNILRYLLLHPNANGIPFRNCRGRIDTLFIDCNAMLRQLDSR
ncbi:hypothetical protein D3C72_2417610 [compost metagenome]